MSLYPEYIIRGVQRDIKAAAMLKFHVTFSSFDDVD
jgi:hypothetical protein